MRFLSTELLCDSFVGVFESSPADLNENSENNAFRKFRIGTRTSIDLSKMNISTTCARCQAAHWIRN